jgi:hypothetical protein
MKNVERRELRGGMMRGDTGFGRWGKPNTCSDLHFLEKGILREFSTKN